MAPRTPVPAVPATPPRVSLLAAAAVLDGDGDRWQGGFSWTPESCGASGIELADCDSLDRTGADAGNPGTLASNSFLVWAMDECSTFGFAARDWQGRARRQLEATQSFQIARELWTGTIAQTQDDPSPYLADADTIVGPSELPVAYLSVLEAWAMNCGQGRRVMVHMSPLLFSAYVRTVGEPAVMITGNVATTALGNLLVTDAGYPGTPPDGVVDDNKEWAYVSPLVQIRLDQVEMLPNTLADARSLAQAIHRPTNTATVWAQRLAAYQLDPCCRFATATDLPRLTVPTPAS